MNDDIKKMFEEIKQDRKKFPYMAVKQINELIEEKKLSDIQKIELMLLFSEDEEFFRWYALLTYGVANLASRDTKFIKLLLRIIGKIKNDMAQGDFISALIKMTESNIDLAKKIYDEMIKDNSDEDRYHYAAMIRGAIGREEKDIIAKLNEEILNIEFSEKRRAAVLVTAQIIMEADTEMKYLDIYNRLADISTNHELELIRIQGIVFLVELYILSKERGKFNDMYIDYLNRSFDKSNTLILRALVDRLCFKGLGSKEDNKKLEVQLVKKVSECDLDRSLANSISYFLAIKHSNDKDLSFQIMINLLKSEKYLGHEILYPLEVLGKDDFGYYKEKVLNYIKNEKEIHILYELLHDMKYFCKNRNDNDHELNLLIDEINNRIKYETEQKK